MYRIVLSFVSVLFFLSSMCHAADLAVDTLIRGVNQAQLTIRSGEVYNKTTIEYGATKTEMEITAWIQKEKEIELKKFTPDPFYPEVDVKEYEKTYLMPYLNFYANRSRQHTVEEHTATLFQVLDRDDANNRKLYQYKLTMIDTPRYPLDKMSDRFKPSDTLYILAYDMQTQVKQPIGDIQKPFSSILSSTFYDSDKHYGYHTFSLLGRSPHVPSNAKQIGKEMIDDVECYGLSFIAQNRVRIDMWVDPTIDFCIRRVDYYPTKDAKTPSDQRRYKKFKKFSDVWYPQVEIYTTYNADNTLRRRRTIEVIAAEFNVNFPKDFFNINKDYYKPQNMELFPNQEESPPSSDTDILLCGPHSLSRVCELLNVDTNLNELKKLSVFAPARGTTMLGLKKAATYKGLAPVGVKASVELLKREKVPLPAIAHVENNHFLVFETVNKEGVKITDPAEKYKQHLTWDELSDIWSGEILIFDRKKARRTKPILAPLAFSEKPVYNFGKAIGGSEIKHTFTIKNIGKKPLKILSVTETCACTASVLSQNEIFPGKTGSISSVLTIPYGNKQVQENLIVHTDDPIQSTLTLTLKGEAFTPLKTFPTLIAFGNQKPLQNPLTKQVSLHLQKGTQILGVRTDSKHLKAALKTVNGIPHVIMQLLPTLPVGQFSHNMLIDYTYNGEQAIYSLVVFGEVIGELWVSPNRLFLGSIKNPNSFSKTITISSRNTQPFQVTTVESKTKKLTFTLEENEKKTQYKVTATISPEANPGEVTGEIIIHTSSSVQPTVRVPFFGIIVGSN